MLEKIATGNFTKSLAKSETWLISLDNNHTKKYNYSNDEVDGFHLCSFKGIDYSLQGCMTLWRTPHIIITKNSFNLIATKLSTKPLKSFIFTTLFLHKDTYEISKH
ncbi:hypothetical protein [Campylobacter helveticus]|uniref:Uncharacterized protein n=1 Tax=Campylobacter helveticus TaxID=28898 RepID=A0AAX2UKI9_9BACT|nr:hypothetical protein [Campylobacter helveticus]ARE80657.1 hypothetical protein CHELV3228_1069 [Campylobacter helveticus]MCR2059792.1 hypothetical protein [Campylobacter helveticus]MCR2061719.1 hypothetical protein [Campylobacter helveticus]TNB58774.1 hypothetical protein FDW42_01230 [Campylobacter helveticus]TNH34796.1 hypothetical protein FDW48_02265 [Campylobacter helveticus]